MSGTEKLVSTGLTRRNFLKTTGIAVGAAGLGVAADLHLNTLSAHADVAQGASEEQIISTSCRSNCFQGCMLNAHVRNGKVTRMSPGDYPEEIYTGCCLRGLSIPERIYSKTRIKYPMRRVGERGEDRWERISWDEAIDEVATKLLEVREKYGKKAVLFDSGSGCYGLIQGVGGVLRRFCNILEVTKINVCYDQAFGYGTNRVIGGGVWLYSNEAKSMLHAKNILIWGSNPVNSQMQNWRIIQRAKEGGSKVTCIDPIFSLTAARSDEFIAIRPGSDLIVGLAILNEIVKNNRIDEAHVKQYTSAPFLIRKDNGLILRRSDIEGGDLASVRDAKTLTKPGSMAKDPAYVWDERTQALALYTECKTPQLEGSFVANGIEVQTVYSALKEHVAEYSIEKASEFSNIPEEKIQKLVDIYAEEGPVFLYAIYGVDHYHNGHLWSQTMAILGALTNNISRLGSGVGGMALVASVPSNPAFFVGSDKTKVSYGDIPQCDIANVISSGKHKGKDYPIKAMMVACSNPMSNFAEQNRWLKDVVPNLDFIVTLDHEFTDTARYSDMVLPPAFWLETDDLRSNQANPYAVYGGKAMEPLYESKVDTEIYALIADKMGLGEDLPLREPTEWIDMYLDSDPARKLGLTREALKEKKAIRTAGSEDVPYIRGYKGAPFPTPSGRAELYCEMPLPRVDFGQDWKDQANKEHFPYFMPPHEAWPENDLYDKYPLVYIQSHEKFRVHTQWFAVESLRELDPEPRAFLSPVDAKKRNIVDDDLVEVFNDRGCVTAKATINSSCMAGVMYMPKGWQRNQHIEGSFQDLTNAESSPMAVNFAYFDALVDVRKKG